MGGRKCCLKSELILQKSNEQHATEKSPIKVYGVVGAICSDNTWPHFQFYEQRNWARNYSLPMFIVTKKSISGGAGLKRGKTLLSKLKKSI